MAVFYGAKRCVECDAVHADTDKCYARAKGIDAKIMEAHIEPDGHGGADEVWEPIIIDPTPPASTFDRALHEAVSEEYDLVLSKQHDYGHDNILRHGLKGLCVRIADKQARLHHIVCDDNGQPKNETLRDTFMDIVGYGLLGLMVLDGTFELPLVKDCHSQTT